MTEAGTPTAQMAHQLHTEVQICREMGWTREELYAQDDDFVWATLTVLSAEGQRMKDKERGKHRNQSNYIPSQPYPVR